MHEMTHNELAQTRRAFLGRAATGIGSTALASLLYLLGIDHLRLTYRYLGRDFRLTDVFGNVLHSILA